MRKRSGLTYIEMIVVISIIGILLAMIIYGFNILRAKARDAEAKNDVRNIRTSLIAYSTVKKTGYPKSNVLNPNNGNTPPSCYEKLTSNSPTTNALIDKKIISEIPTHPTFKGDDQYYLYCSNGAAFQVVTKLITKPDYIFEATDKHMQEKPKTNVNLDFSGNIADNTSNSNGQITYNDVTDFSPGDKLTLTWNTYDNSAKKNQTAVFCRASGNVKKSTQKIPTDWWSGTLLENDISYISPDYKSIDDPNGQSQQIDLPAANGIYEYSLTCTGFNSSATDQSIAKVETKTITLRIGPNLTIYDTNPSPTETAVDLTWKTNLTADCDGYLDSASPTTVANNTDSFSKNITGLTPGKTYDYHITCHAHDDEYNTDQATINFTTLVSSTPPTSNTCPVVTPEVTIQSSTAVDIPFTASPAGFIEYSKTDDTDWSSAVRQNFPANNTVIHLAGLEKNTTYNYHISLAGYTGYCATGTFTTPDDFIDDCIKANFGLYYDQFNTPSFLMTDDHYYDPNTVNVTVQGTEGDFQAAMIKWQTEYYLEHEGNSPNKAEETIQYLKCAVDTVAAEYVVVENQGGVYKEISRSDATGEATTEWKRSSWLRGSNNDAIEEIFSTRQTPPAPDPISSDDTYQRDYSFTKFNYASINIPNSPKFLHWFETGDLDNDTQATRVEGYTIVDWVNLKNVTKDGQTYQLKGKVWVEGKPGCANLAVNNDPSGCTPSDWSVVRYNYINSADYKDFTINSDGSADLVTNEIVYVGKLWESMSWAVYKSISSMANPSSIRRIDGPRLGSYNFENTYTPTQGIIGAAITATGSVCRGYANHIMSVGRPVNYRGKFVTNWHIDAEYGHDGCGYYYYNTAPDQQKTSFSPCSWPQSTHTRWVWSDGAESADILKHTVLKKDTRRCN